METHQEGRFLNQFQRRRQRVNYQSRLKSPGDTNTRTAELRGREKSLRVGMDLALEAIGVLRSVAS